MLQLSVVITAFNEAKRIEACLQSVKDFADEIVVVDNGSTDDTATIAKKYTKHIYSQKNDPQNIDIGKNFGFSKATGEWILSLDADERVTPSLREEIIQYTNNPINQSNDIVAYWIPRKNMIFGKWIEHTGWYPDYQLRLFRNGKGKYVGKHVHEDLHIEGKTEKLSQPLVHQHYETIAQFILHNLKYIENEAENKVKQGYKLHYLDAIRFPFQEFLSRFFAREGYKDGLHGLVLSLLMAWYHFMIFATIWEKKGYKDMNSSVFVDEIEKETKKAYKELIYWFYTEKLQQAKDLPSKYLLKIKQKIS